MSEYTPTTDQVKGAYHKDRYYSDPRFRYNLKCWEEFDRWLNSVKAEVWKEAVGKVFGHCVENPHWTPSDIAHLNPYNGVTNE